MTIDRISNAKLFNGLSKGEEPVDRLRLIAYVSLLVVAEEEAKKRSKYVRFGIAIMESVVMDPFNFTFHMSSTGSQLTDTLLHLMLNYSACGIFSYEVSAIFQMTLPLLQAVLTTHIGDRHKNNYPRLNRMRYCAAIYRSASIMATLYANPDHFYRSWLLMRMGTQSQLSSL